ncbi:PepSY domain-containing protein [Mesorhizobium sp. INR15]|uniref:PepSY domain-containing protein n=1 Tax=Mesorhizobium sp. INR15 TaxID=2654248 RepID=UPI001896803D|nr:PepSY domain-containing protein [Mesorhizobium sp. INR15]QPC91206.1 PepSY domain-containing protein [Mesorhizobium sp. INR15]
MKKIILATFLLTGGFAGSAFAADKCDVPADQWQPREALQKKLEGEGWKVRSIKSENGCYEAKAIDAKGKKLEAVFNPKTLETVGADSDDG